MPYYCNINACRVPQRTAVVRSPVVSLQSSRTIVWRGNDILVYSTFTYICIVIYPKNTLVVRLFGHSILPYMAKYHAKSK